MNRTDWCPAGTPMRGWPKGAPCATESDQVLCSQDAEKQGLCAVLMAHGRVCVEKEAACPVHKPEHRVWPYRGKKAS